MEGRVVNATLPSILRESTVTIDPKFKRRISFTVTEEQYYNVIDLIPWGLRQHIYSALTDRIIELIRMGHIDKLFGAIISGDVGVKELLKIKETDEAATKV